VPGAPLDHFTLTDGGQTADAVGARLVAWLGEARRSLDLALYDVRLPGEVGDAVAGALREAAARGVAVRIVFNEEEAEPLARRKPLPPPPITERPLLEALGVPVRGVPGEPDLMHHKFAVRDDAAVWTGSANWTLDSWTRQENVLVTVESPAVAASYARCFEDLWRRREVEGTGAFDARVARVGDALVRPWFAPGRGPELSHRIAERIAAARRRVRIASPVLTAGPILGTLNEVLAEGRVEVGGVSDATQVAQVFEQWRENPRSRWKGPLLARLLSGFAWTGKRSTRYAPGSVHDFMHAKVTVADDVSFVGSFNLSRSGEMNAENVLEIADRAVADRMAAFVDDIRGRFPALEPPGDL